MRYFLKLAYNGSNYHGWQIQDNAPSVQETINKAISTQTGSEINLSGCGRTDTGVHAEEFYAHFDLEKTIVNRENFVYKLNNFLPSDIVIFELIPVSPEANARFDAISRTYKYYITKRKNPFRNDQAYTIFGDIDISAMNKAAEILKEYTDFTSFSKLHTQVKTNNCKITEAYWKQENDLLVFTITADRFLRNMVRAIVGTLLEIGKGKSEIENLRKIIDIKDRSKAGFSVPAQGLFLTNIQYPKTIFKS
ncbi:tRNA pseudouridine(38-40) synthase TruA [Bacteroidota bacterium]